MASGLWSQNQPTDQAAPAGQATPTISFGKDVRPILSKHCWSCHGPDEQKREAQLRLDRYEDAIQVRDGKAAIRPGDWKKSELMRRVESADMSERMPPAESGPALTEQQKKILRQWIDQGGAYEAHWAFEPPRLPSVPMVKDQAWCRSPIDAFVLEKMNEHGLHASPPATPKHGFAAFTWT